jgi:hypothetical protein
MRSSLLSLAILSAVLLIPLGAGAQSDPCGELGAAKEKTYGFLPSQIPKDQRQAKSEAMDHFWELVQGQGSEGVSCLRTLLREETGDVFFLFDASNLLYSLDQSEESLTVISGSLARTSLKEIDPAGYLWLLVQLAQRGADTGFLADNYMRFPDVDTYLPRHGAMKLDRELGAVLAYGSMPSALADKHLTTLLAAEEPYARRTAALLLSLNLTEDSLKALSSLPGLESFPETLRKAIDLALTYTPPTPLPSPQFSREQVLQRLERIPDYDADFPGVAGDDELTEAAATTLLAEDLPVLREARRRSINGVSDEALYEYFALTAILREVVNRLDLYKEYRKH